MAAQPGLAILVLYCHALLGEGIGRLLGAEPGASVRFVSCEEPEAIEPALAEEPDVIVVERCERFDPLRILGQVPDALVLGIGIRPGATWVYRRQEIPGDPESILRLVRRLRGGHPVVSLEPFPLPVDDAALAPPA
ncbi:MAG TPA: hypothetical protein VF763_04985 [Candidatus Limnocylindrales bacterium]